MHQVLLSGSLSKEFLSVLRIQTAATSTAYTVKTSKHVPPAELSLQSLHDTNFDFPCQSQALLCPLTLMSSSTTQGAFTHSLRTSLHLRKEFTCLIFSVYSVSELPKQSVRFTVSVKLSLLVMWLETNMLVTCIRAAGASGCWHAQNLAAPTWSHVELPACS